MRASTETGKPTGFAELWPSIKAFHVEYGALLRADAQKVKTRLKDLTAAEKVAVCENLKAVFNIPETVLQAEMDTAIGNAVNWYVSNMNLMKYVDEKYDRAAKVLKGTKMEKPVSDPSRLMVVDEHTIKLLVAMGALVAPEPAAGTEPETPAGETTPGIITPPDEQ
jgi:hypothetical protein